MRRSSGAERARCTAGRAGRKGRHATSSSGMPYAGEGQRSPVLMVGRMYQRSPPVVLVAHQTPPAVVTIGFRYHQGDVLELHVVFVIVLAAVDVVSPPCRMYGNGIGP